MNEVTPGIQGFFSVDDVLPCGDCMVLATELYSRAKNGRGIYTRWTQIWYSDGQFWELDENFEPARVLPGISHWMYFPPLPVD